MGRRPKDPGTVLAKRRRKASGAKAASTFEREGRIIAVQQLMDAGMNEEEIRRWLMIEISEAQVEEAKARGILLVAKTWKVSEVTARDYIRTAWRGWNDEDRRTLDRQRTWDRRRAMAVFRIAYRLGEQGDSAALGVALRANDQLARMHGSYEPAPPPPEERPDDMDAAEARKRITHAFSTLSLADRPGRVVSTAQEAAAIDVPAPTVEEAPAEAPKPPAAPGGAN